MIVQASELSIDDYHASDFVSNSKLQTFDELGPGGYAGRYIEQTNVREETPALRMGNLAEDAICGRDLPHGVPELMADPAPEPKPWSTRRKVCKEWLEANPGPDKSPPAMIADGPAPEPTPWNGNRAVCKAWLAEHPDALTSADLKLLQNLHAAVQRNATALSIIELAQEQMSLRGEWPGLPGIQARPDWLVVDHPLLGDVNVDLKTTDKYSDFVRSVHKYGYNKQAGFVDLLGEQCGLDLSHYLLVVEKRYPFRAQLKRLSHRTVATGRAWVEGKLDELSPYYGCGEWPVVEDDVELLDAPVYGVVLEEVA